MRQVVRSAAAPTSFGRNVPAPTGGWNARDPIAAMPPKDAVFLDNFFPSPSDVQLRKGSALFATLPVDELPTGTPPITPHNIRTIMSYQAVSGTAKLFVGLDDGIYDATAGGSVAAVSSAATNAVWQFVNVTTAGGSFLWCCNGVDKARYYTGSAWVVLDTLSTPALTGITSTDVTNVSLFKSRLFLTEKDSLSFWYLPVNSVAGAAVEFPMGALFRKGGHLMATGSWTLDGGNGPDDYFVAVTSEGEVAVYAGIDPSNAATWALQGVYELGSPLTRRCLVKTAGDLCVLTVEGLYPLSKTLLSGSLNKKAAVSDKISKAWVIYTSEYKDLFGWQPIVFRDATMLLVNVPVLSRHDINAVYSYQFVMNTQTGAWCRFTGLPAEVWGIHDGKLFFALHNKLYQAWTGSDDNGLPIDGKAKTASFYPAGAGSQARVTLLRPLLYSLQALKLQLGVDTDYDETQTTGSAISYAQSVAMWDNEIWDQSYWSVGASTIAKWRSVAHKPGRAVSVRLRVNSKGVTMSWIGTDLILQKGGLL